MLLLKGIAGKAHIVTMLAKENDIKIISYKKEFNLIPDATIYNTNTFKEFLQATCFELSRELRSNKDLKTKHVILYTNVYECIILKHIDYIKNIENTYSVELIISCMPNEGYY